MADFNPGRDEVEDVAAMKREGDLSRFLRQQIRDGQARRSKPTPVKPAAPPGYRPGAWPSGTSPPGPLPGRGADWDHAVACCPHCQVTPGTPCHLDGRELPDGQVHNRRYLEAEETAA